MKEEEVDLARIVILEDVQVRDALDEDVIAQYVEVIDDVPPIVLFDTGAGRDLLELADGFQRLEAAIRAGRTTIRAVIRTGTHDDVLDCADTANAKHGKPLTTSERHKAVRRLYNRHYHGGRGPHAKWDAGWSVERIACEMGYSPAHVREIAGEAHVGVGKSYSDPKGPKPQPDVQTIVQGAPEEYRADLAKTAQEQHWSSQEAAVAVQGLRDPEVPQHVKEEMVQGLFPPVQHGLGGQYVMSRDTIDRQAQALLQADVQYHLSRMLGMLAALKARFTPQDVAAQLPAEERLRLVEEYSGFMVGVDYVLELRAALQETGLHVLAREGRGDGRP